MNEAREVVKRLCQEQRVGVLCTQRGGQVHASLVCLATTDDLKTMVFATPKNTRKYEDMLRDSRVAMMVHDSVGKEGRLCDAAAVAATGRAIEVRGAERDALTPLFLDIHGCLKAFVESPDSALMRITVDSYRVALSVKDVVEFRPGA